VTAEIAILNKTAIALAADSAVTISVGENQQKVYDSEDKLFELSRQDAIGIMINNNMHFMETPLPVLIKRYRAGCGRFDKVEDAALDFLKYLQSFGSSASQKLAERSLRAAIEPVLIVVRDRAQAKFVDRLSKDNPPGVGEDGLDWFRTLRARVLNEQILTMQRAIEGLPDTESIGDQAGNGLIDLVLNDLIAVHFPEFEDSHQAPMTQLTRLVLEKRVLWSAHTGIIVAGYGRNDIFPTLISFEIFGSVGGQLRFFQTNHVDIDREGTRAKVIPFAQKEMVDRFLYGLDDDIQRRISDFCKQSIPHIRELTIAQLDMPEDELSGIESDMKAAEEAFLDALREQTFDAIRQQSEEAIEDMVEFMPKSEMGKMAEALVNLTSIKRRVSRGVETVGGPIDVAVISQADGFVWVQRKHYFPQELNSRFFDRMREQISTAKES